MAQNGHQRTLMEPKKISPRAAKSHPRPGYRGVTANQVVAYNLARARELRGLTQEEAAAILEPFLGVRWSKASFSQAERSVAGKFVRKFDADEVVRSPGLSTYPSPGSTCLPHHLPTVRFGAVPPRPGPRRPSKSRLSSSIWYSATNITAPCSRSASANSSRRREQHGSPGRSGRSRRWRRAGSTRWSARC